MTVRAFFALPLPGELLQAVITAQAALKKLAPELRWLDESKLHLTLKFLGVIADSEVVALGRGLDEVAARLTPIVVRVAALDAFPSPRRARVLVLRLSDPSGTLVELAGALDVLGESAGVARETRPFKAHVTLARARPPEDVCALIDAFTLPSLPGTLDRARLYQSTLRRAGSTYDVLHECVLGGAGDFRAEP